MIGGWLPNVLIHIFTVLVGLPAVLHSVSIAGFLLPLAPSFGSVCLFKLRFLLYIWYRLQIIFMMRGVFILMVLILFHNRARAK